MTADKQTIELYNARAADYQKKLGSDQPSPRLLRFIAALPDGGTVLDLGCGPGSSAAVMRDHGLVVTALDASVEMARVAKDLFDLDVTLGSFDDVTELAIYDGVWANFSLLHAPRTVMPRHLTAIHRALRAGGRFLIGLKTGTGERRDALGRIYTYYTQDELTELLQIGGFTVDTVETGAETGLSDQVEPFIIMTAHA